MSGWAWSFGGMKSDAKTEIFSEKSAQVALICITYQSDWPGNEARVPWQQTGN